MRNRSVLGFLAVAGLIAALAARPSAAGSAGSAPKRPKLSCAEFGADVQKSAKAVGMNVTIKAGDWAKTPAALRALPPGATMCGSSSLDASVYVASPLFGKDLETYYRPIFEKLGCKPLTCEIDDKLTSCKCRGSNLGGVRTEELSEVYSIRFQ